MRIAFTIALLATIGLAYSVFFHEGLCGTKSCSIGKSTPVSTGAACCNKDATMLSVSTSEWTGTVDAAPAKSCCAVSSAVAKQDGEGSCCEGGSCCQQSKGLVTVSVAKQDGEASCCSKDGSCCKEGSSCCKEGAGQVTVSVAKQDGEKCEGTCSEGGTCCQKAASQTVSVAKQDGDTAKCTGSCQGGECAKCPASGAMVSTAGQDKAATCQEGTCCVAEAMKKLPAMTYKVGTESTCCAETAAKMAEKAKTDIKYVVAGEEFSTKELAFTALVDKTESFVNEFVTPKKCEASGKTSLCGSSIDCCDAAAKQTEVVVNATKDIKVGYQVGEHSACCANGAKALAEKLHAPIEYVVNGEKTKCEMHARLMAAQAKYVAAVKAMAASQQASAETKAETKTETKTETKSEG